MADRSRSRSASRSRSRSRDPVDQVAPAADDAVAAANADADIKAEPQVGENQQGGQAYDNEKPIELYVGNLSFSTRDADLESEFRTEVPGLISALVCMDKYLNLAIEFLGKLNMNLVGF